MANNIPHKWLVFSLVAAGVFMSTLDSSVVNIALPVIMADFQVTMTVIEWVPMIYLLTVSALLLTCGRLSDIRGRRLVYCGGFMIFSAGSLLCGLAGSASWLIASRTLQGVGAAMLMACSPALVVDVFPMAERGRALGMVGMVVAAGLTTGPALGGLILQHFSWRVIFYINVPIGIVFTVAALRILPSIKAQQHREPLDWIGALLLAACFSSFITVLSHLHEWGPVSAKIGLAAGLFLASSTGLAWMETRSAHPIFDPSLLGIRLFMLPVVAAVIMFICLFFITFLLPFFMVHPLAFSMNRVGATMMIPFVFLFFFRPAGRHAVGPDGIAPALHRGHGPDGRGPVPAVTPFRRGHDHGHGLAARPGRHRHRRFHIPQQRRGHERRAGPSPGDRRGKRGHGAQPWDDDRRGIGRPDL